MFGYGGALSALTVSAAFDSPTSDSIFVELLDAQGASLGSAQDGVTVENLAAGLYVVEIGTAAATTRRIRFSSRATQSSRPSPGR